MRLAIDIDDTVLQFTSHILACIKTEYAIDIDIESITDWHENSLKHLHCFAQGGTWWDWLKTRDWLWSKCPAVEGAIGGIQQLRDQGHHIELITAREQWSEPMVWQWIGKWRPAAHRVTIVPLGANKAEYTGANLLVDDGPHNIIEWRSDGRPTICFDRPWNRHFGREVPRAKNWADVVRMIGEIA